MGHIKVALKKFRASQPFNYIASSTVRFVTTAADVRSEFAIKHLPRVGLVKSKLPNNRTLRLWSRGDDWVANQVYWRGWNGYEPEASEVFFHLAKRSRVTFDVGAHVGFYALLAGHANLSGQVYAFEPLPATFARLRRNIELNELTNVKAFQLAVGDVDGTVEFYKPDEGIPCSAGMSSDFYKPWADYFTSLPVESVTVDAFVRKNHLPCIDLIKIDTETTEPQVLRGMIETIKRDHPIILCEVLQGCGSESLLEEILNQFGYRFYLLTSDGPVLQHHIEGHPRWMNYLFTAFDLKQETQLTNGLGQFPPQVESI
jgi:FkbM family methyltransferase